MAVHTRKVRSCDWPGCDAEGREVLGRQWHLIEEGIHGAIDLCPTHRQEPLDRVEKRLTEMLEGKAAKGPAKKTTRKRP